MRRLAGARRSGGRRGLAVVALALAVAGASTAPATAQGHGAGSSPGSPLHEPVEPAADRVVVVGVAGLRWDDVGAAITPQIAAAATGGSVGSLSVRSAPSVTCPADGWLTLGAGGYAAARAPAIVDPRRGCTARPVPRAAQAGDTGRAAVPESTTVNDRLRFDARPGWLAEQVPCVTAAGPGAGIAAADPAGGIDHYVPRPPATAAEVRALAERCPATLIDGGVLPENGARPTALAELDQLVGAVRSGVTGRTVVMVLGVSETVSDRSHLHVAIAEGPGFGAGWLASASTRRVPYVQLADVAPTIAAVVGGRAPDGVAGRPMVGGAPGRPESLAGVRRALIETDVRAGAHRAVVAPFFAGFGAVVVAVCGSLGVLLHRRRRGHAVPARAVAALRSLAVGLAAVPASTFVANLVPWWRSEAPAAAVAAVVAACAAALWALATVVGARSGGPRRALAEVVTIAVASLLLLVADVVTGARLQIDSLLGYNPLVAGRFVGLGNIAFAVLGASAVVLGALAAHGRSPVRAATGVALVGVPVVIIDGWPRWGADVGGVLTLVPVFGVLALLVAGRRVRPRHAALVGLGGAAVAGFIGALDYLRPAGQRSHFGRFVGTSLDGGALDTIRRKADASLDLLTMGPHTVAAAAATIVLAWVLVRPPVVLREAYGVHRILLPMHRATLVLSVVGLAVNDSIVAVPMVVALVVGPVTLALCASSGPPVPAVEGGGRSAGGGAGRSP